MESIAASLSICRENLCSGLVQRGKFYDASYGDRVPLQRDRKSQNELRVLSQMIIRRMKRSEGKRRLGKELNDRTQCALRFSFVCLEKECIVKKI